MHLIKEKLLFMEVSIICSSFIYGERHEERVSGVGGGEGGRVQKCILKYFFLVTEEKMEAVTIPIKKKTLLNLCLLKKGDKAVLQ